MLVTLRTFGALDGVLEEDDSSLLRLTDVVLEGVEPLSRPLVCEGVWWGVERSRCGFLTARLWLWMSLSMSFALRFKLRSELPLDILTGDGAAAKPLRTGWLSSKSLALRGGEAERGEGFFGLVLTGMTGLTGLPGRSLWGSRAAFIGFARWTGVLSAVGAFFVRILEESLEGV